MALPIHTPYDGSARPFTIGLKPLAPHAWIEIDHTLARYLAEKEALFARLPQTVFRARSDTPPAQREVLDLLADYLPNRFADIYRREDDSILVRPLGRRVRLESDDPAPLRTASLLVPEDLVLMRRVEDGWRLVAASLCFPSSWSLAEKFDRPLQDIHQPVPGFGSGTRTATVINRIFDNLSPTQPVWRMNWSLAIDPSLHLPLSEVERRDRTDAGTPRFPAVDLAARTFIRVERQTLRRLPLSGDILFTIRIYVDPLAVLFCHPERRRLAAGFAAQLSALNSEQLAYKGLAADRDRLVAELQGIACD
jgi:hypothetical protein